MPSGRPEIFHCPLYDLSSFRVLRVFYCAIFEAFYLFKTDFYYDYYNSVSFSSSPLAIYSCWISSSKHNDEFTVYIRLRLTHEIHEILNWFGWGKQIFTFIWKTISQSQLPWRQKYSHALICVPHSLLEKKVRPYSMLLHWRQRVTAMTFVRHHRRQSSSTWVSALVRIALGLHYLFSNLRLNNFH